MVFQAQLLRIKLKYTCLPEERVYVGILLKAKLKIQTVRIYSS